MSLYDVIEIARVMRTKSMAKELSGMVKEVLGTRVFVSYMVDGSDLKDVQDERSLKESLRSPEEWRKYPYLVIEIKFFHYLYGWLFVHLFRVFHV